METGEKMFPSNNNSSSGRHHVHLCPIPTTARSQISSQKAYNKVLWSPQMDRSHLLLPGQFLPTQKYQHEAHHPFLEHHHFEVKKR